MPVHVPAPPADAVPLTPEFAGAGTEEGIEERKLVHHGPLTLGVPFAALTLSAAGRLGTSLGAPGISFSTLLRGMVAVGVDVDALGSGAGRVVAMPLRAVPTLWAQPRAAAVTAPGCETRAWI